MDLIGKYFSYTTSSDPCKGILVGIPDFPLGKKLLPSLLPPPAGSARRGATGMVDGSHGMSTARARLVWEATAGTRSQGA